MWTCFNNRTWSASVLGMTAIAVMAILLTPAHGAITDYEKISPENWQVVKNAVPLSAPDGVPTSSASLPYGTIVSVTGQTRQSGHTWLLCSTGSAANASSMWLDSENLVRLSGYSGGAKQDPRLDLSQVEAYDLPRALTIDQAKFLVHSGFYIDPVPVTLDRTKLHQDDLIDLYELLRIESPNTARFITADLAFHAFDLYVDRILQKLENRVLIQRSADLLAAMRDSISRLALRPDDLANSLGLDQDLTRAALTRAHNFILLGLYLVSGGPNGTEPQPIQSDVREFANKILAATGTGVNPFTGTTVDFTDFQPTGHYARNEATQAYYRTLKLLSIEWPTSSANVTATNDDTLTVFATTLVLQRILNDDQRVQAQLRAFYDPIVAITGGVVGLTNTLAIAGTGRGRARTGVRSVAVLPRRSNFDDLVFSSLSSPNVTGRPLPDVLDVLGIFGSAAAKLELEDNARDYKSNADDLRDAWRRIESAGNSVYTDVLRALAAYIRANQPKSSNGSKQYFASTGAWEYKKLTTGAAVLAELQQDTEPFFARDFAQRMHDDGIVHPEQSTVTFPCGYVEPVPEVYTLLSGAARRLAGVIEPLLPSETGTGKPEYWFKQLDEFAQKMTKLAEIATREKSDSVTPNDFDYIKNFTLPRVLPEGYGEPLNDAVRNKLRVPRIATAAISRESNARTLDFATGAPLRILVWVNDKSGGFRVTEGYALSFFSYAGNAHDNTIDRGQKWREQVYAPWELDSEERGPLQPELERGRPSWFKKVYF